MTILLIVIVLIIFTMIFIGIRIVYPDLIYTLRQALVEVEVGQAFNEALLADGHSRVMYDEVDSPSRRFNEAQITDMRFESLRYEDEYIRERICNIKKLYHMTRTRNHEVLCEESRKNTSQRCVKELADLLSNCSERIVPDEAIQQRLCVAEEILTLVANKIELKNGRPGNIRTDQIQQWFEANPITVEQTLEILSAVLYAHSYRNIFQKNKLTASAK